MDRNNRFVTIRQEPTLVKLSVSFDSEKESIIVTSPTGDSVQISAKNDHKVNEQDVVKIRFVDSKSLERLYSSFNFVRIWGTPIEGIDCGPECGRFFQKYLGKDGVRLLRYHPEFSPRPTLKFRSNQWTQDRGSNVKLTN